MYPLTNCVWCQCQGRRSRSRKEHTAAEEQFCDNVCFEFDGPSPRPRGIRSQSPTGGNSASPCGTEASGLPRFSETHSPRSAGSDHGTAAERPVDLSIDGQPSPRYHLARKNSQTHLVMAAAPQCTNPSPRSNVNVKAMLLDQAEVVGILNRMSRERVSMRLPTAPSFNSSNLDGHKAVSPGAVAKKAPAVTREKYKGPSEKADRNVLKWFAEHGSAKKSLRTMSSQGKGDRKRFQHDWRSPAGHDWKLGGGCAFAIISFHVVRTFRWCFPPHVTGNGRVGRTSSRVQH
jgi:hypothetical protein